MMFLQYVIWGSWYVTLNTYLTSTLHFSGTEAGAAFSTVSIACLVSPFFVGLVADRFFSTERVMAVLYALGALCMILLSRVTTFPQVFGLLLAFCLCYFPTIALSNSIAMQQVKNPGRDFPPIRVMGTLGWIAVNLVIGFMEPSSIVEPVRRALREIDPELPLANVRALETVAGSATATRRLTLWLVLTFGLTALVLAVVGIYGVMGSRVSGQRLRSAAVSEAGASLMAGFGPGADGGDE